MSLGRSPVQRVAAIRDGRVTLVLEPRSEAHGGALWSLPRVETARGELLGTREARGDVVRESTDVVRGDGDFDASTETFPIEDVAQKWASGEMSLAPEVPPILRGTPMDSPAWEVAPGVHVLPLKTPTLLPATHTNAFLLGSQDAILVEPASSDPGEVERVVRFVDAARARGVVPRALCVTHHHIDHVGGAAALSDALGLPLWAHAETAARCPKLHFARLLEDGERLELDGPEPLALEVLHTPGHAAGHLCFLDPGSGLLLAGDMVAGVGTILIEPGDGDMNEYLAQLERLATCGARRLVPSHGGLVLDAPGLLSGTAAHRRAREAKVVAALRELGSGNADDLVPLAYADTPRPLWPLAALSVEAHLLGLAARGEITREAGTWQAKRADAM